MFCTFVLVELRILNVNTIRNTQFKWDSQINILIGIRRNDSKYYTNIENLYFLKQREKKHPPNKRKENKKPKPKQNKNKQNSKMETIARRKRRICTIISNVEYEDISCVEFILN